MNGLQLFDHDQLFRHFIMPLYNHKSTMNWNNVPWNLLQKHFGMLSSSHFNTPKDFPDKKGKTADEACP